MALILYDIEPYRFEHNNYDVYKDMDCCDTSVDKQSEGMTQSLRQSQGDSCVNPSGCLCLETLSKLKKLSNEILKLACAPFPGFMASHAVLVVVLFTVIVQLIV